MIRTPSALLIACLVGSCTQVDSIDGLKGGTVSGSLSTDGDVVADGDISAVGLSVDSATIGDLTVEASLRVRGAAAFGEFSSTNGAFESLDVVTLKLNGVSLGSVVGRTARGASRGNDEANEACATAFSGSHVCSEIEFMTLSRFVDNKEALDGATVNVAHRVVQHLSVDVDGEEISYPFVVDNCEEWERLPEIAGAVLPTTRREVAPGVETAAAIPGRAVVAGNGSRIEYSLECALGEVDFLCCS